MVSFEYRVILGWRQWLQLINRLFHSLLIFVTVSVMLFVSGAIDSQVLSGQGGRVGWIMESPAGKMWFPHSVSAILTARNRATQNPTHSGVSSVCRRRPVVRRHPISTPPPKVTLIANPGTTLTQ